MPRPVPSHRWARLAIIVATCASLAIPVSAAQAADNAASCPAPSAAVAAINPKITALDAKAQALEARAQAHNAKPNVFTPQQRAAAAAHSAEAAQGNAEKVQLQAEAQQLEAELTILQARLMACFEAMETLMAGATGSLRLPKATTSQLDTIAAGISKLGDAVKAGKQPPPRPVPGESFGIPQNSPLWDLYQALLSANLIQGDFGNVPLQGKLRPLPGSPNPVSSGSPQPTFGASVKDNGLSNAHVDRVIPIAESMFIPGFLGLTPLNMTEVVNAPANMQWLSPAANLAEQSPSVAGIQGLDERWKKSQAELKEKVAKQQQDVINRLLLSQGDDAIVTANQSHFRDDASYLGDDALDTADDAAPSTTRTDAAKEQAALNAAQQKSNVNPAAPQNHQNGAMAEELGYAKAVSDGEIGILPPGKITATGPDYVTFRPDDLDGGVIVVWDSKYSGRGRFPSKLSDEKMAAWRPTVDDAVNTYTGPHAREIKQALADGRIVGEIFRWPPS